jgi:hypothetical protein
VIALPPCDSALLLRGAECVRLALDARVLFVFILFWSEQKEEKKKNKKKRKKKK